MTPLERDSPEREAREATDHAIDAAGWVPKPKKRRLEQASLVTLITLILLRFPPLSWYSAP